MDTDNQEQVKIKVFVSYSRRDVGFTDQIVLALESQGFQPILDRHDIDAAEEWQARLSNLILSADAVVFVLTENSAASPVCAWEIEEAARLAKRLVPILPAPLPVGVQRPERLAGYNEIYFYSEPSVPGSGFFKGVLDLQKALSVDIGWLRGHTDLSEQAARWTKLGRNDDFLLRGQALIDAQDWQDKKPDNAEIEAGVLAFMNASQDLADRLRRESEAQLAERETALRAAEDAARERAEAVARLEGVTKEREEQALRAQASAEEAARASRRARTTAIIGTGIAAFLIVAAGLGLFTAFQETIRADKARAQLFADRAEQLVEDGRATQATLMALYSRPDPSANWYGRFLSPDHAYEVSRSVLQYAMTSQDGERLLSGHRSVISEVTYSSDGAYMATASYDGTARVFSAETGELVQELTGHTDWIRGMAFRPGRPELVTVSDDARVLLWRVGEAQPVRVMTGHEGWIVSLAMSDDGTRIATGANDHTIRIWDLETGAETARIRNYGLSSQSAGETSDVPADVAHTLDFSPDGRFIVAGSTLSDGRSDAAAIYDAITGALVRPLYGAESHEEYVTHVEFHADSRRVLSASYDDTVRVWSVDPDEADLVFGGPQYGYGDVNTATFHPADRNILVTGTDDGVTRFWNLETQQVEREFPGHSSWVIHLAVTPDGGRVAAAAQDGTIRVFDTRSGAETHLLEGHEGPVTSVSFNPAGDTLISGSEDATGRVWTLQREDQSVLLSGFTDWTREVRFSPDGRYLATAADDAQVRIWNPQTGELLFSLPHPEVWVFLSRFSPDGRYLVTSDTSNQLHIWDMESRTEIPVSAAHGGQILDIAFSPDRTMFATASADNKIGVWNLQTGELLHFLPGHADWVRSIAFAEAGATLISGGDDNTMQIWDVVRGVQRQVLTGHSGWVNVVAASSDDLRLILSAGDDRTIRVYTVTDGAEAYAPLKGHEGSITRALFSPDDSLIISADTNGVVRIWNALTGQAIREIEAHDGEISRLSVNAQGTQILTSGQDGAARIWDIQSGDPLFRMDGHQSAVLSADFSPGGDRVVTSGGADLTARLWTLPEILRAADGEHHRLACEHLRDIGAPLSFTENDRVNFPILRDELTQPGSDNLRSPCSGLLAVVE